MGTQQFSLRWNNYLRHITGAFDSLRTDSDLVDVTLSCEGKKIKAHKMLLSACSSYFKDLFKDNPCQHPVIIFRNVKFDDLDALVNFMYQGEVNVLQDQLASFLTTAELLEVQGLTDGGNNPEEEEEPETEQPPPPPVQHREFRPEKRRSVPQSNNQTMSPVSFIPINKRPESPPQKRRKFVSSTSSVQSGDKDLESRRPMQQQQHPSPDPVEVIPVVPNVKVEKPDYYDGDQGGGDYSDNLHTSNSNQELPEMLEHGQIESKQEAVDIYEDSDSSHVEGLSDLNQILNKPGTSVESVSQESLHDSSGPRRSIGVVPEELTISVMDGSQTLALPIPEEGPLKSIILVPAQISPPRLPAPFSIVKVQKQTPSAPPQEEHPCGKCCKNYGPRTAPLNSCSLGATSTFFPDEDTQKEAIAHPSEVPRQSNSSPSDFLITNKSSPTVSKKRRTRFNCVKCGKKYKSDYDLRRHMDMHTGKTTCPECGKVLSMVMHLKEHLRNVHKRSDEETTEKEFTRDRCKNVFKSRMSLRNRESSLIGETTCKLCEKIFPTVSHLKLHVCSVRKQSQRKTKERTFNCGRCKKVYKLRHALNVHMKSRTGKRTCELRRKRLARVRHFRRCLLSVHKQSQEAIVGRETHSSAPSDIHEESEKETEGGKAPSQDIRKETERSKASSQDSQFTCGVCKNTYKYEYNLKTHMRSHTGETTCKLCGKVLCRIDALKEHVRRVHQLFQ